MKNRTAFFSGFALFLCFCLLSASGKITDLFREISLPLGMLAAETAAFSLPALVVKFGAGTRDKPVRLRGFFKISSPAVLGFTLFSSIAVAILTFLINYTVLHADAGNAITIFTFAAYTLDLNGGSMIMIAAYIIIPPFCEELFLRGTLLSAHEKLANTGLCILLSGIAFAMLQGSADNLIGPLLTGLLYAYLTYCFDCVWLAVLAHMIHNFYYVVILWLTETYSAFGIWKYFSGISLIALLAFSYLALRLLETLLATGQVRRFRQLVSSAAGLRAAVCNLGFLVFALAFAAKAILHLF